MTKQPKLSAANSSWSHSRMTTFEFEHVWKIDQFSSLPRYLNKKGTSAVFSTAGHDLKFQLSLYPKSSGDDGEKFISLYFACFSGKTITGDNQITFELSLLKNDGNILKFHGKAIFNKINTAWGYKKFAEYSHVMDPKNGFLHENHQLVVGCKATVSYNRTEVQSLPDEVTYGESKFKANLKSLLESGDFSDFTIVIGAETATAAAEFPVHKNILSAHSPVFKAMFSSYTVESQQGKVKIADVTVEAMKGLLQFIYTGESPPLADASLSLELLTLADKYQVEELKLRCEVYISSLLTVKNVVGVYVVASRHSAAHLKAKCLNLIALHFKAVSRTSEWEQLVKAGGEQLLEVTRVLGNIL